MRKTAPKAKRDNRKSLRITVATYELLRSLAFRKRMTIMEVMAAAVSLYAGRKV